MNSNETPRMNAFGLLAGASLTIACAAVCLDSAGYPVRGPTLGALIASWALGWSFALSRALRPGETRADGSEVAPGDSRLTLPVSLAAASSTLAAILMRRFLPGFEEVRLAAGALALLMGPGLSLGCVLLDLRTPLRDRLLIAPPLSFGAILVATSWMAFLGAPLTAASLEATVLAVAAIGMASAIVDRLQSRTTTESR